MIEALAAGERDPRRLAALAKGRLRAKLDALEMACDGRFTEAHGQMRRLHLGSYDRLSEQIATLDALVAEAAAPFAAVLAWVGHNSVPISALAETAIARRLLGQATGRLDGKNAAASTVRRHRIILANAMDYAVELGLLETNPIRALKWTTPKVSSQVDRLVGRMTFGCLPVHMAERWCLPHPGGGVGRAWGRRAAADLRQMRRRPGRARQAPDERSTAAGLTWSSRSNASNRPRHDSRRAAARHPG